MCACLHIKLTNGTADIIDQNTQEIRPADEDETIYSTLEDLVEDLPQSSPRFILLSYPFETVSRRSYADMLDHAHAKQYIASQKDGRLSVPYVLLYWLPQTCNDKQKMSYANAKELMRNTAEVQKVIQVVGENDDEDAIADTVDGIKTELAGSA